MGVLVALVCACPRGLPTARDADTPEAALTRGDTLGLARATAAIYRRHGVDFDRTLTLELHRPDTLSSYYRFDGNRIVLASAADGRRWPGQLRALSMALRYAAVDGFPPGLSLREAKRFVNVLVLLLAAHEQAHYLHGQYAGWTGEVDPAAEEALANRFAVAVLRELARERPALRDDVRNLGAQLERILRLAPATVTAYPPEGHAGADWLKRHYALLVRHEPGVYFVFQLRSWLSWLRAPAEDLDALVEAALRAPARARLAAVRDVPRTRVRVQTTGVRIKHLPSDVLAINRDGEVLVDVDGRLARFSPNGHGAPRRRDYVAFALPYGDGHRSNFATWAEPARLYAARPYPPETLVLYAIDLDEARREARGQEVARFGLGERFRTLSHDEGGALYAWCESESEHVVYRVDVQNGAPRMSPWRRLPRRPPGHRDGRVSRATFDVGGFAVLPEGVLAFADPTAFSLRRLDDSGVVTTFFGRLRGRRDGGRSARTARPSHLAAGGEGFYFLETEDGDSVVRAVSLSPERARR